MRFYFIRSALEDLSSWPRHWELHGQNDITLWHRCSMERQDFCRSDTALNVTAIPTSSASGVVNSPSHLQLLQQVGWLLHQLFIFVIIIESTATTWEDLWELLVSHHEVTIVHQLIDVGVDPRQLFISSEEFTSIIYHLARHLIRYYYDYSLHVNHPRYLLSSLYILSINVAYHIP